MSSFILRRLLQTIPTLLGIITLTFFLVRLAPGGPFSQERSVSEETLRQIESHYGLNKPLLVQYGRYLLGLLQGDLGPSYKYVNRTVSELIVTSLPVSLELGLLALLFSLLVGIPAGLLASVRPNTWSDHLPMTLSMVGISLPTFVLGPLLILFFGLGLGWLSVAGWAMPGDRILPAITLGAPFAAYVARLTRGGMLEILPQDFIRTARAKGLSRTAIVLRHALRGGIAPVVSFLGPALAGLVSGSFVVETIFQIPGLGRHFVAAAFNRDYFMVQGTVLLYATLIIVFNLLVDIAHVALNPRLRFEK